MQNIAFSFLLGLLIGVLINLFIMAIIKYSLLRKEIKYVPFWQTFADYMKKPTYSGRASRVEFLNFSIISAIILSVASVILFFLTEGFNLQSKNIAASLIFLLFILIYMIVYALPIYGRRWHDMGKSLWYPSLIFIGIFILSFIAGLTQIKILFTISGIANLYFNLLPIFKSGTKEENKYGQPPFTVETKKLMKKRVKKKIIKKTDTTVQNEGE